MDFVRVYALVADFLADRGARLAVVGGLGLHGRGITRATLDLDVLTEAATREPLTRFLESTGYETLHCSAGFSNHLHADPDFGRLDVLYVDPATADALFAGAEPCLTLGSRSALVPRAEHLAAMKVQAMKNDPSRELQDLADIRALLGLPGVSAPEVQRYFERAGLLDRYDAIQRSR
jgi:hypothetical protein